MKPKKILLVTDFAFPVTAGTERLVFGIADFFSNNYGIQTDILCPDWNSRGKFEESENVKIYRFSTHAIQKSNPAQRVAGFVGKAMELGGKYDVYAGFYTMPPLIAAILASKLKGSKSAVVFFGREQLEKNMKNPLKKFLLPRVLSSADVMTSYTWNLKNFLEKIFPNKKIFVTNGFAEKSPAAAKSSKADSKEILYVGRMTKEKGVFVLLEAFSKLPESLGAKLVIAGPPYEREAFDKRTKELSLKARVKVLGFVSDKKLSELYEDAFVVTVPSLFEDSFGLSLMEAISYGKPVVSTDSIGIPGISGELVVAKNDPEALASILEKLFSNDKFYLEAKSTAKKMSGFFKKEKVMESYLEAFEAAMG